MSSRPIHPFPARMASEIALARCRQLPAGATVLDPMAGSGTVLRAAVDAGHHGIGFDIDPLAVLMARVWTMSINRSRVNEAAAIAVARANETSPAVHLPWIDDDPETRRFVDFWFAEDQQQDLRRLSAILADSSGTVADVLRVALSRIIVTKEHGASLARDASHSRPHRVRITNDFAVMPAFLRAADQIGARLAESPMSGSAVVSLGDARNMASVPNASIDAVITSPPYLNALDYLRGHRLSLVWLGYRVSDLRAVRATSIGAERMLDPGDERRVVASLAPAVGAVDRLPERIRGMIDRFALDVFGVLSEVRRVLRPRGSATLVVGNSCIRDVYIDNAACVVAAASTVGLHLIERQERELPPSRRYLPPPSANGHSGINNRMRAEVVLTFAG